MCKLLLQLRQWMTVLRRQHTFERLPFWNNAQADLNVKLKEKFIFNEENKKKVPLTGCFSTFNLRHYKSALHDWPMATTLSEYLNHFTGLQL